MLARWSPCTCKKTRAVRHKLVPCQLANALLSCREFSAIAATHLHNFAVLLVLLDVTVAVVPLLDGLKHAFQIQVVVQALHSQVLKCYRRHASNATSGRTWTVVIHLRPLRCCTRMCTLLSEEAPCLNSSWPVVSSPPSVVMSSAAGVCEECCPFPTAFCWQFSQIWSELT